MIIFLIILFICTIVNLCFHIIVLSKLVDFQLGQTTVIDLCFHLENNYVKPLIYLHHGMTLTSILAIKKAWPIFLLDLLMSLNIIYIQTNANSKRAQIFEPATIVRDISKLKIRHLAALGINFISSIYLLVITLLTIFGKKHE